MRLTAEDVIADDAAAHHGVVSRRQLLDAGLGEATLYRRVHDRTLVLVAPEVYRCAGAPVTWHQRLLVACLTTGDPALASHRSAAVLWGLDGFRPGILEVTTPLWLRRRRSGVRVHESTDLDDVDRTELSSIPVTTIERTLIDLGAVVPWQRVEQAFDDALRRRLTTPERVLDRFLQVARRGRRGVGALRPLLDARVGTTSRRPGEFERRVWRLIADAGVAEAVCEHEVRTSGGALIARVDLALPWARIAIECDSVAWHSGRQRRQADLDRQNRLVLAGWTMLRFTWDDLVHRPDVVVRHVAAALSAAS